MRVNNWMTMAIIGAWLSVAALAAAQTSPTVKDDLFAGTEVFAKGASDVTEVTMDPDTLGMVDGKDGGRAHRMVLNVVRTYSYDKPGLYNMADVDAFRNKLNTGDWHCSVHTRSLKTGESTDICNKHRTDDMTETAIITVEPKELTFIHTIRKRRPGESGDGEGMTVLPSLNGLPMMAMLSPGIDARIDAAMATLDSLDVNAIQARVQAEMKANGALNSAEMKKRMAEAQRSLQDAQRRMQHSDTLDTPTDKQPE